jgi:acyl-CoA oxidase
MITAHQTDPTEDLRRERSQASFPSRELAALMAGGEAQLKLRERIADAVRADPVFSKKGKYFMERADLYRTTLEKYLALPRVAVAIDPNDPITVGKIIRELIDEPGGLDLHLGMFIPTIQGQGDDEQKKHWLPMCIKLQIIGTYAQTELGHGTYIRGLETTATYDAEKEQFVIHSPTLTATKWWPGGMGKTSTHAVVMARLITHGIDRGPHAFVVQIRRNEDHQAMPGVVAGDIGPKMGYNAVDNGFLRFDHVRVPRRAMLMRHSKVDADGTFHPPPVAKASYGTMVFVRSDIVMNAALYMKKAVTIAVRYNLVRRQSNPGGEKASGGSGQKGMELQVIDYQHSQRSLFPILARAFAFHCTSDFMRRMYFRYEKGEHEERGFQRPPRASRHVVGAQGVLLVGHQGRDRAVQAVLRRSRVHADRGVRDHLWKLRPQRYVRRRQQRAVPPDGEVPPQGGESRREGCRAGHGRSRRGRRARHERVHPRGRRGSGARVPAG